MVVCYVIQCTLCRYDQRATDIACQNARSSSDEVKEKVKELIHGWFTSGFTCCVMLLLCTTIVVPLETKC